MPELERALRELGRELSFPESPDLAAAVGERLRALPRRRAGRGRTLVLAFAVAAAALAATLAVPQARGALLELLGIRGASVERVPALPAVEPGAPLVPGERVSAVQAQRAVDFPLLLPSSDRGRGCVVRLDRSIPGGMVSAVCGDEPAARYVLSQFLGSEIPYVGKLAGPETRVSEVRVRGGRGVWIDGAPHVVVFRDADGEIREQTRRTAGDVLLWERGGVTYRLEGALGGREGALRIAADLG